MANLKPCKSKNGKIHYYVRVFNNPIWSKPKLISLKTTDYKQAMVRKQEIEDKEKALKQGMEFTWSWEEERGRTRIKKQTLQSLINKWLIVKGSNVRKSSVDRYRVSMNAFTDVIGKTCPMSAINTSTIEKFKKVRLDSHSPNGINIDLRGIKCFLLWCKEEGYIKSMPKIKQLKIDKSKPKVIKDSDWDLIMQSNVSDEWKDIFKLYRDIGARRNEVVFGRIEGTFLIVDAENSKSGLEKEIQLTQMQQDVVHMIHNQRDKYITEGKNITNFVNLFTKTFRKVCEELGLDYNFHCLRHTYAVRRYFETKDIYLVSKELGHTSVLTTEKYAQFNPNRLAEWFPTLVKKPMKIVGLETLKEETLNLNTINSPR
jgi:integrase